jgi:hypothetical protein
MSAMKSRTSRRAFFLSGGAALGAGLGATTAAAASGEGADAAILERELARAADREAIRQLQLRFAAAIEERCYEVASGLFDEQAHLRMSGLSACGSRGIASAFDAQYRCHGADTQHCAYRQGSLQLRDDITLSEDGQQGTATFHVEALLGSPVRGDSTVAVMARLQGNVENGRWERGRLLGRYVKRADVWRVASLEYLPA